MTPPADEPQNEIEIELDGERLLTAPDQIIASVLLAQGRLSWRGTLRTDAPRGIFCGIGVCFDCVLTVNDQPFVRACLRRVQAGDKVVTS